MRYFWIVLASAIFAVLVFEAIDDSRIDLRFFPSISDGPAFVSPGLISGKRIARNGVVEYYDQFGMRAASTESRFPHETSIALIGDSLTVGAEAEYPDTLQARLEVLPVNVLNFGVNGSSSIYYARAAKWFMERTGLRPSVAIVSLYTDMAIGDVPRFLAAEQYGEWRVLDGVGMPPHAYQALSGWRRLLFNIDIELRRWSSTYSVLFPRGPSPWFAISVTDTADHWKWEAMIQEHLDELAQALGHRNIIIWLAASNKEWADPELREKSARFWLPMRERLREKYVVIDPREQAWTLPEPFTASGHFTGETYRAIADALLPSVREILEQSSPR